MRHVGAIVSIEVLDLHSTDVGDAGIAHLSGLSRLEQLDLSFTSVSDAALDSLSRLTSLKKCLGPPGTGVLGWPS